MTQIEETLASSRAVVRSGMYNLAGFAASSLYMILIVPVALHFLGIESYGLWTMILALAGYLGLVDLGLSTSFVTYLARFIATGDYDRAARVVHSGLGFYGAVTAVMMGICLVGADPVFRLLRIADQDMATSRTALFLAVGGFFVTSVAGVYGSVLTSIQRVDALNAVIIGSMAVRFAAIVASLSAGYGVAGLLVAEIVVTLFTVPILILLIRRQLPGLPFSWRGYDHALMKTLLRFGLHLQVSRLADMVQQQWDKLLLKPFLGFSAVSMYDFGSRPAGRLRLLPLTAIASLVPAISALDARDDQERIHAAFVRGTRYLAMIAAPMFGIAIAFASPLIALWLGPGYSQAAWTLRLLSIGLFVNVIGGPLAMISQGRGEPQYQMRTTLVQAGLNLALSYALIVYAGYFGAVCGTVVATTVGGFLFFWVYGRKITPRPLRFLVVLTYRPVLCVAPAALLGLAVGTGAAWLSGFGGRVAAAAEVIAGGIVFLGAYIVLLKSVRALTADDVGFFRNALPPRIVGLLGKWQ